MKGPDDWFTGDAWIDPIVQGLVESRGEDVVELRPGDIHFTPHAHEHWHGATHDHFMTHISSTQGSATWGDHVTDAEYGDRTG